MRLPIYLAAAAATLVCAASANAHGPHRPPRPAAPQVTVGADLKQLTFDWNPVRGATYYRLLVNADGHSGLRPVGRPIPAWKTFATSLALDGSGRTLAIGAVREASVARGIDGDRSDNSARDAGAVYLY